MGKGSSSSPSVAPHVLIFPFPAQGHINSMLKLAELLALSGLRVTFLNTEHVQGQLDRFTHTKSRLETLYPGFSFKTVPDGLPPNHPRSGDSISELFESMNSRARPVLKELLTGSDPVNCVISDGVVSFGLEVAMEVGIPVVHFRTISACAMWTYFCIPDLIEAGELPIKGEEDMDRLITKVRGMEGFLRCRDLPRICRVTDMKHPSLWTVASATRQSSQPRGLILNTFEDLEGPVLSLIRANINPNTYTIGPLHELLKTKLESATRPPSSDLWKADRGCLKWLDDQPPRSVIYVSFGSLALTKTDQVMEFWHGLVNSKRRFLWVRRPGSNPDSDSASDGIIPGELLRGTKERGKIVEWAPQEEVLAHKAVGGFLTHSGWNSTLESIAAGVPMLCWPYFYDQQVNSAYVDRVWGIGLDMKDVCDRSVVEKMVDDLMGERQEELLRSASKMSELARKSSSEVGSSFCNLERLVQDISSWA